MLNRCTSPTSNGWERYGGRGISVCDRWRSFENFLADMGERPPGTSIDRIDVNGNYEPGNCRWATETTQQRNRRSTKLTEETARAICAAYLAGEGSQSQLAKRFGVTKGLISQVVTGNVWGDATEAVGRSTAKPRRVLTAESAAEIKALHAAGEKQMALARRFGVSRSLVYDIVHDRKWRSA
jgi:transposase